MAEAEIGVIRAELGIDFAPLANIYAFGPSDFAGFDEFSAVPQLVVYSRNNSDRGVVFLTATDPTVNLAEEFSERNIDDERVVFYDPQGRLVEIEFRGISRQAVVDDKIPLPPNELDKVRSLVTAYRTDIEQGKPGEPGRYHFIPVLTNPVVQSNLVVN